MSKKHTSRTAPDKGTARDETIGQSRQLFELFTEIGIIQQLSTTLFNRRLPDGLHVSHFSVISHLVRLGDGQTPLALSRAFQVTKGTMTNTLNGLSRHALVTIEPHATDGRSKLVFLTRKGRTFHQQSIQSLGKDLTVLMNELDTELLLSTLPELRKLRQALDRQRDL